VSAVDDLVAFVRQQLDARERKLDEDERVAQAATVGPWEWGPSLGKISWALEGPRIPFGGRVLGVSDAGCPSTNDAEHITRWNPKRVLDEVRDGRAEIEATHRILRTHSRPHDCAYLDGFAPPGPCSTLVLLAQRYAGQPGWREEWRA